MHYYQFNIGDYRRDTQHLSFVEHGIYRLLLDQFYLSEKPLNANALRLLCIRSAEDIAIAESLLKEFFIEIEPGQFIHKKAMEMIEQYRKKSTQASDSAKKRWLNANAMRTHSDGNANHKPKEPINLNNPIKEKEPATELPDWLPTDLWKDYLQARKALKAPMTERAKQLAIKKLDELMKQGYPPKDVLSQSIYNGWKGLFPLKTEKESWHDKRAREAKELIYGTPKDERVIDGEAEILDWPPV